MVFALAAVQLGDLCSQGLVIVLHHLDDCARSDPADLIRVVGEVPRSGSVHSLEVP